jgi:GNAT superfamily N-acetyltransferase
MFDYLIKSVDWGISIKATVGDKIVGCYLLSQEPISSCDSVDDEKIKYYSNLYGLQGISLAVSNEYRNMGIGKALRDETLNMGYDYIWGYQSKELNNIDNWVKFGRKIVGETYFDYITLMDLRVDAQIDESYIYLNDGIFIPSFKS